MALRFLTAVFLFLSGSALAQEAQEIPGALAEPSSIFSLNPEENRLPQSIEPVPLEQPENLISEALDDETGGEPENSRAERDAQTPQQPLFGGIPFNEIPEEYLEEMDQAYQDCASNNFFNQFLDCECRAIRFLEKRIELGPEPHYLEIKLAIENSCPNPVGIAGYTFKHCAEWRTRRNQDDYEDFCKCVANTVALNFESMPRLSSIALIELRKDAILSCGYGDIERANQVETERMLRRRRQLIQGVP